MSDNSILKNNTSDFSIVSIKIQDRNKISYKIKNSLSNYVGLEGSLGNVNNQKNSFTLDA